jgi:5-hydroxyisourate hydrolase-like protein (transthyretin family)
MTRNKRDKGLYCRKMDVLMSRYSAIGLVVLVSTMALPLSHAELGVDNGLIKLTANSWKKISVVKVENSRDNIYSVKLVWLTLQNGVIESYKSPEGWVAERSSTNPNSIQFRTETGVITPGESARFGFKSDQENPIFQWIVIDEEGDELGSGTLDVKAMKEQAAKEAEAAKASSVEKSNDGKDSSNSTPQQPSTNGSSNGDKPIVPTKNPAIAVQADEIRPGVYVRLLGEGFMPDSRMTVLFDGKLIATLRTAPDGTVRDRVKIPSDAVDGAHQIAVSDNTGRAANLPVTVTIKQELFPFIVATEKESYKRGELVKIAGTGKPSAAVSLRAADPSGNSIFTSAVPVGTDAKYTALIPLSETAMTGEYTVFALQEGRTLTIKFKVLTEEGTQLSILTDKFEYMQGESVVISGQGPSNKDVNIRVLDPNGNELFTTTIKSDETGSFAATMIMPQAAVLGKYSVVVKAGNEEIALNFSVIRGSIALTLQTDKNEYRDGELVRISGKGKPNDRVKITILTPKEDRIPMSANTKEDGTYSALWLIQKTAAPGNYEVIAEQGESRIEAFFAVSS